MEVVAVPPSVVSRYSPTTTGFQSAAPFNSRQATDAIVIESTLSATRGRNDSQDQILRALSVTAREVVEKLNELLADKLPEGLKGLKQEDTTPEATAERIVSGATSYFEVFKRQNPNLSEEELLNRFLSTIRGGIDRGYSEAVEILEGLGAFEFEGVKNGVEKTRQLVDEKLAAFEAFKREELGLPARSVGSDVARDTSSTVIGQGAGLLRSVDVTA
jgi:hypothetical protein